MWSRRYSKLARSLAVSASFAATVNVKPWGSSLFRRRATIASQAGVAAVGAVGEPMVGRKDFGFRGSWVLVMGLFFSSVVSLERPGVLADRRLLGGRRLAAGLVHERGAQPRAEFRVPIMLAQPCVRRRLVAHDRGEVVDERAVEALGLGEVVVLQLGDPAGRQALSPSQFFRREALR